MIDSYKKNKEWGFANFFFRLMGLHVMFSAVHNCAVVVQKLEQTIYKQMTRLFSNKILFRKRWPTVGLLSSDTEQLISYF